jgi:hypothetical protein
MAAIATPTITLAKLLAFIFIPPLNSLVYQMNTPLPSLLEIIRAKRVPKAAGKLG